MATYISDTRIAHLQTSPQAYEYVTLTGNCTRSGNTVTLSSLAVTVRVSYVYSAYGESQNYYIATSAYGGAITQTGTFTLNFSDGPNHTETHTMPNASITVGITDTSKTLYLRAAANEDAQIPFTITFPSGAVAPTTPTISVDAVDKDFITITYGTTSFGTPSTGTVTLYGGTSPNPTTVLDTATTTGDHTFTHTGLTSGTTYYYRAKASNGQLDSSYSTEVSGTTPHIAFYGPVNDQTKLIKKFYGSVNGLLSVTGSIAPAVIPLITSFNSTTFNNYLHTHINDYRDIFFVHLPVALEVTKGGILYSATLYDSTATYTTPILINGSSSFDASTLQTNLGVTVDENSTGANGFISLSTSTGGVGVKVTKVYGSVNGQTKRFF